MNTIVSEAGITRQFRGKYLPSPIRSFTPGVSATMYNNAVNRNTTDQYLNVAPISILFQNGGGLSWNWIFFKQNLEEDFNPLNSNIAIGNYHYNRHRITYRTDPSKKISLSTIANRGDYYNGRYHSVSGNIIIAPSPHFYFSGTTEIGKTFDLGENRDSRSIQLYSIESRLAVNPRIQLTGLFQKSSVNNTIGWNFRFSWEYKPLSYVYLVFNSNSVTGAEKNDNIFISKISYLKQF
jgi:hypothetical protein